MNDQSTYTDLIPLKMCSATVTLDQYQSGWSLAEVESNSSPEPRSFEYYIGFDNPFSNIPVIHAGIAGFDIDNQDTNRMSLSVKEVSNSGFKVVIQTWMHTRIYMVEISWIALGSV
jgi:hypothetical protein